MYKKSLISVALASTLALSGCFESGSDTRNAGNTSTLTDATQWAEFKAQFEGKTWPVFDLNPQNTQVPLPNDLIFSDVGDGSLSVGDTAPPVTTALNRLSGASTVAPIDIQMSGPVDDGTVVANSTVFLLELDYFSGAPLQALGLGEAPFNFAPVADIEVDVESFILSSGTETDFIRITPTEPLSPNKRYIVLITNGIEDASENPISGSPFYNGLKADIGVAGPFEGAVSLVQFWENVAGNVVDADDIAFTYSFTTSNDKKVLEYIAQPQSWFEDQLTDFVNVGAVRELGAEDRQNPAEVHDAITQARLDFDITELLGPLAGACNQGGDDDFSVQIQCGAESLVNFGPVAGQLPRIGTVTDGVQVDFSDMDIPTVSEISAIVSDDSFPGADDVRVVEGSINVPYYLDAPVVEEGSERGFWRANRDLGATLNNLFEDAGLEIPQGTRASDIVNAVFPFPKETVDGGIDIPLLVLYPDEVGGEPFDPDSPDVQLPVVIYQHGITTDRSTALTFGTSLAAQGVVVIAIDQPLHGVAPIPIISGEEQDDPTSSKSGWAGVVLSSYGAAIDDNLEEEYDFADPDVVEVLISFALADGGITVDAFVQNVIDALGVQNQDDQDTIEATLTGRAPLFGTTIRNSGSTIPGLSPVSTDSGFDPAILAERHFGFGTDDNNQFIEMNFNPAEAAGASGDLFINLESFANSRDLLRQGAVDLMSLRASISEIGSGLDSDNVYFVGHSLGTVNGGAFVAAANASGRDELAIRGANLLAPVGGLVGTIQNSPQLAPQIAGGVEAAQGLEPGASAVVADLQTFFRVFQHAVDSVDPINFAGLLEERVLFSQIDDDQTVINDGAGVGMIDGTFVAPNSPLSGSEPLARLTGAEDRRLERDDQQDLSAFVTFSDEAEHSTPVLPDPMVPLAAATFVEMVTQTLSIIQNEGISVESSDSPAITTD